MNSLSAVFLKNFVSVVALFHLQGKRHFKDKRQRKTQEMVPIVVFYCLADEVLVHPFFQKVSCEK